jgi:pyruvate/2-oxoglutarate dehydrogenase complex dihydrolipoamide acyltransferase (E2) component
MNYNIMEVKMAQLDVKLPELGEGIDSANVSFWHVEVGDTVKENDDLLEAVTEKATFNVPSPSSGKVSKILFNEGDEIKVGEIIAILET